MSKYLKLKLLNDLKASSSELIKGGKSLVKLDRGEDVLDNAEILSDHMIEIEKRMDEIQFKIIQFISKL